MTKNVISCIRDIALNKATIRMTNNFISLREASKISGYSSDYLGYLIRNGSLKGQKVGRNWVTTNEDLNFFMNRNNSASLLKSVFLPRIGQAFSVGAIITIILGLLIFISISSANNSSNTKNVQIEKSLDNSSDINGVVDQVKTNSNPSN